MATLDPATALETCENALRQLMAHAYQAKFGPQWLQKVTADETRAKWAQRHDAEPSRRKGIAEVPPPGLAYADFGELVAIAKKHWQPLAPALGKQKSTMALLDTASDVLSRTLLLLDRAERLRNPIAHNRPIAVFEADLLSGIAGQIRNQVTIYMSSQDAGGDYYPRIESARDSFGQEIKIEHDDLALAGRLDREPRMLLHPGEVVTFTCTGIDPQDRDLEWQVQPVGHHPRVTMPAPSGMPVALPWTVTDDDVMERSTIRITMSAIGTRFHRGRFYDHSVEFCYRVRPLDVPGQPTQSSADGR